MRGLNRDMLVLTRDDVAKALPMDEAIGVMRRTFIAYSSGLAAMPLRARVAQPHGTGTFLSMAVCAGTAPEPFTVKVVGVFPENTRSGLPSVNAAVILMNGTSGVPEVLIEGTSLTALRTGATTGLATDLLSKKSSTVVAMIGAGVQARTQVTGICSVREIGELRVYARDPAHVNRFIDDLIGHERVPDTIIAASDLHKAVRGADIICTATTSSTPVIDDRDVSSGAHINGIGSYLPGMQEIPEETVRRATIVVDSRVAALAEAGDLVQPIRNGTIGPDHIHAELGEVLSGMRPGRVSEHEITFFKSVGIAVQDAFAAVAVYEKARSQGYGSWIDF